MALNFKKYKIALVSMVFLLTLFNGNSQTDKSKWKLQLVLGINSPSKDGFASDFEAKPINFPTINFGVQHMFNKTMGAKLDFGYNRFSNANDSPEFKTNYSRVNAQFVYDATSVLNFLPAQVGMVGHAGLGYSMIKPLGNYGDNKASFLNAMAGLEVHYSISESFSVFTDFSYILGFSGDKTYDPVSEGYGTFNGNLLTITFGVSVSLSGCYYCD